MISIRQTETFRSWLARLRDDRAQARINMRIRRLSLGNAGDAKSVGAGVWEMRIDYGPGYRVYYTQAKENIVLLLLGGDKSTQEKDIRNAIEMAKSPEA
jgi:putative addiction module killer protein